MNNRLAGRIVRFDEIVTDADFAAIFEDAKVEEAVASAALAGAHICSHGVDAPECTAAFDAAFAEADCE